MVVARAAKQSPALCAGIAASAAPPRHDGDMVIASAAQQSPALCAGIAASAAPPRHDGDMVIASAAQQSPALCAGIAASAAPPMTAVANFQVGLNLQDARSRAGGAAAPGVAVLSMNFKVLYDNPAVAADNLRLNRAFLRVSRRFALMIA